jgi:hypothetical protein
MSKGRGSAFGNSGHDEKSHLHEFERDYVCGFVDKERDEDGGDYVFQFDGCCVKELKGDCNASSSPSGLEEFLT